ncbi:MAG: sodium:solute symporter family protein [Candidatus Loosdrechtia sp.]|uniref:sodium:solute symporter family protein n=1 Tax=Candidatus Loosdrechtia sp. TaxID=3101272 RepID=UPI003A746CA0|nr:MAG: sodium:solute symporter family protein [Candidatus Jettenia sp. AMX2]
MIDLFIIIVFVIYAISAGFRAREKASQNLQEYFLAGRTLTGWKAGMSMAATQFAADTPLLVTGLIATGGIYLLWRLWIYGIAFLMMGFIFAVGWRHSGVLTDAELTEIRYSGKGVLSLRMLKAIYYGTVINCVVMAMVLVASVRIAEIFMPWHLWLPDTIYQPLWNITLSLGISLGESVTGLDHVTNTTNNMLSILTILAFTTLYSTTGGLRSVVATDMVQFGIGILGSLIYAIIIVRKVGGLGALADRLAALYGEGLASRMISFGPPDAKFFFPFLVIISLQWFFQMSSDGTGYLAQRSIACQSDRQARLAAVVFSWMQIFVRSLVWLIIGIGLLVLYPFSPQDVADGNFAASREILFVTGINDLLPPGIRGLMLTGLLAALASTIDTHLNWGASYWSNDVYKRFICQSWLKREAGNRELVIVARLSNILILTVALIIMTNLGSIQKAWFITVLFGAGMGSVLILRWLWERINLYSELAAIVASLTVAPILIVVTDTEWIRLLTMAMVSTAAAVGITYFTPLTEDRILVSFYRTVIPMGFWKKTALLAGDDPRMPLRNFYKGLEMTILSALSLFLLLLGAGKLVIHMPGKSPLWAWICIIIGIILIPIWWRSIFGEEKPFAKSSNTSTDERGKEVLPVNDKEQQN